MSVKAESVRTTVDVWVVPSGGGGGSGGGLPRDHDLVMDDRRWSEVERTLPGSKAVEFCFVMFWQGRFWKAGFLNALK
jgi:hypothetical protein